MILVKFVFFCQIVLSEGHFWNFEIMGNRQSQKKILKTYRKNHALKIYILKYVSKWKMDVIFVIKVAWAFLRKLINCTQVWPFTLTEKMLEIFSRLVTIWSVDLKKNTFTTWKNKISTKKASNTEKCETPYFLSSRRFRTTWT